MSKRSKPKSWSPVSEKKVFQQKMFNQATPQGDKKKAPTNNIQKQNTNLTVGEFPTMTQFQVLSLHPRPIREPADAIFWGNCPEFPSGTSRPMKETIGKKKSLIFFDLVLPEFPYLFLRLFQSSNLRLASGGRFAAFSSIKNLDPGQHDLDHTNTAQQNWRWESKIV